MKQVNKIKGYEDVLDIYFIDKRGFVFSQQTNKKLVICDNGKGYKVASLKIKGKRKWKKAYIHRLVAMAYVEGYNEKLEVNHKDENKANNHYTNLEWVTTKYNNNYGTKNEKISISNGHKCYVYDYKLNFKGEFNSIKKASEELNTNFRKINSRNEKYFIVDGIEKIPEIKSIYTTIVIKDLAGNIVEILPTNREARRYFDNKVNVTDAINKNWIVKDKYKIYKLDYNKLIDSPNLQE